MGKKRKAAKAKRGKRRAASWGAALRSVCLGAAFVVACVIGVLYLHSYLYPAAPVPEKASEAKPQALPQDREEASAAAKRVAPSVAETKTFKIPAGAEIPRLKAARSEQVIAHEGYTVSYNSDYRIANWVAYELTPEESVSRKVSRSNKFVPDPMVKGATAMNEDYTRTGYDRGHLAPAGDMKWSAKAMRESFYLSNICPQKPGLNRGVWKDLEEQCRVWAKDYGPLLIATGPVVTDTMKRMGKNRVGVPASFYKVICRLDRDGYKAIAFIFENRAYKAVELKDMAIPVDSVEKVTGIDFYPSIPDDEEKRMEASVDHGSWSF